MLAARRMMSSVVGRCLIDAFNRANTTSGLGNADSGQAWNIVQGDLKIASNVAVATSPGGLSVALGDVGAGNMGGSVTIHATATGPGVIDSSLVFRGTDASTYLFAQLFNGAKPGLRIGTDSSGTTTGIAYDPTLTVTTGTDYTVTVTAVGASILVNVNGVDRLNLTLTAAELATYSGVQAGLRSLDASTFNDIDVCPSSASIVTSPYRPTVLSDSPLAWWRFNEALASAAMIDRSGNGRDGSYTATGVSRASGLVTNDLDHALGLSGAAGNGGSMPYASWMNVSALTVEFLIQSTDTDFRAVCRETPTNVWSVQIVGGRCYFISGGLIIASSTSTSYTDGSIHHVAVTYDGSNVKFYKDGSADGTTAWAGPLPQPTDSDIVVGHGPTTGDLTGTIDEVAVYGTALSSSRIAAHHAAA